MDFQQFFSHTGIYLNVYEAKQTCTLFGILLVKDKINYILKAYNFYCAPCIVQYDIIFFQVLRMCGACPNGFRKSTEGKCLETTICYPGI